MKNTVYLPLLLLAYAFQIRAQDTRPRYDLLRPVPKTELRLMETDRPDVTESPITVEAGHFQYESDIFRKERSREANSFQDDYLFNQANLKLGIFSSTDLQLILQSYVVRHEHLEGEATVHRLMGSGILPFA